jgi:pimeloyl-ACP methyl ester carboxylesterase
MADYVLVHGAWHGAWCWQRVLPGLLASGHRAFAVTLTGLGERAAAPGPAPSLATHIDDVAGALEADGIERAILVGHSYGGMVITGVADRSPERVAHLVYVDGVVPRPGESWSSTQPSPVVEMRRRAIADTGVIPPPSPLLYGLDGDDAAWVGGRLTPQPGATYDDVIRFDATRVGRLGRTFVDCTRPALATIDLIRQRVRAEPGWRIVELATGHDAMISAPHELLQVLLETADAVVAT